MKLPKPLNFALRAYNLRIIEPVLPTVFENTWWDINILIIIIIIVVLCRHHRHPYLDDDDRP